MKHKKAKQTITLVIMALCLVVFAVLALATISQTPPDDIAVFENFILNIRSNSLTVFFKIITCFGGPYIVIPLCLLMFIFKDKKLGLLISANLAVSSLVGYLFKHIFCRARPEFALVQESSFSFPSMHAVVSVAVFGMLIFFAIKYLKNKPLKICLSILFATIILLVCFSRLYLGVHYLTDILAGMSLSAAILIWTIYLTNHIKTSKK